MLGLIVLEATTNRPLPPAEAPVPPLAPPLALTEKEPSTSLPTNSTVPPAPPPRAAGATRIATAASTSRAAGADAAAAAAFPGHGRNICAASPGPGITRLSRGTTAAGLSRSSSTPLGEETGRRGSARGDDLALGDDFDGAAAAAALTAAAALAAIAAEAAVAAVAVITIVCAGAVDAEPGS